MTPTNEDPRDRIYARLTTTPRPPLAVPLLLLVACAAFFGALHCMGIVGGAPVDAGGPAVGCVVVAVAALFGARAAYKSPPALDPPIVPYVPPAGEKLESAMVLLRKGEVPRAVWPWLAPVALLLFVAVEAQGSGWVRVAVVTLVLFVHELGHFLAMRAFGFRDTRIFFVPFFGAITTGAKEDAPGWQRAIVLLAGPTPGIFFALALLLWSSDPIARMVALYFGALNGFNLLPLSTLDGGLLVELLVDGRARWLNQAIRLVMAALLGLVALRFHSVLLGLIAIGSASPVAGRLSNAATQLRTRWPNVSHAIEDGTDVYLADLALEHRTVMRTSYPSLSPGVLAAQLRRLHGMLRARPLGGVALAVIAFVYVGVLGLGWLVGLSRLLG